MNRFKSAIRILLLFTLTLVGCFDFPEDVILPEWDVELNIPIIDRTYSLYDMFKPESKYSITSAISGDDFYLVQTNNFNSVTEVAEYIDFLETSSVSQSVVVPANAPATSVYLEFPDQLEVDRAIFESGILSFAFQNPTASIITTQLRVPGIRKPDGTELVINRNVPAFSTDSIDYDITNHSYILPANQPEENKNSLQFVASANSEMNGSYENVNFYMNNLNFKSITGVLPRLSMGNKRASASLNINDAADFRDKLFIKEGSLYLITEYVSNHQNAFEVEISNAKIIGKRSSGEELQLTRKDGQEITFKLANGNYNLKLDEINSNLIEFISWLPDSIIISSEYIINPSDNNAIRTLTNQDSIKFALQFLTKSIFAVKQINFIDTLDFELSQDDRNKIQDGIEAELNIYLENAIPIDVFVKATITDENYSPLFIITRNQSGTDSLHFLGGQVNTITGEVISPSITLNSISLNSEQIHQLSYAHHMILSSTVNTKNAFNDDPNPPTVQFKSSDWMRIKTYGKVKYHFAPEEE